MMNTVQKRKELMMKIETVFSIFMLSAMAFGCNSQKFLIKKDTELDFTLSNELKEVFFKESVIAGLTRNPLQPRSYGGIADQARSCSEDWGGRLIPISLAEAKRVGIRHRQSS